MGRSSGAVRRLRGFPSLDALLRALPLHVGCGWSLRETAVQAKLAGIAEVSDVTLFNRLRDAESWLRQMCQELWKDNGVQLHSSFGTRTVRLLHATVVREPPGRCLHHVASSARLCHVPLERDHRRPS
jgi:hypothetical protein